MKILSYFCPFSKKFNACQDFKKLTGGQKALTIFVTVLASIATAPLLGLGGVAAFRALVQKYTCKKIDPAPQNDDPQNPPSKDEKTARKVNSIATKDEGATLNPKKR